MRDSCHASSSLNQFLHPSLNGLAKDPTTASPKNPITHVDEEISHGESRKSPFCGYAMRGILPPQPVLLVFSITEWTYAATVDI